MKNLPAEIINVVSKSPEDNFEKIKYFDRVSNSTALILGKLLKENIEGRYWEALGYDSFTDFIAQGGFSFTRKTAYNYIELWECFCKWKVSYEEFISIPYSKILKIKVMVNDDNLDEWLGKAKELSRSDLELEIKEVEANKGFKFRQIPKIYRCRDCDGWIIDCDVKDLCSCGKGIDISSKSV